MASVDWEKIKSVSDLKALIRHNDKELREENEHSNENIDKSLTWRNHQFCNFDECLKRFSDRIDYLDRQPKANKRKDRVLVFALEAPVPLGFDNLTPEQQNAWYSMALGYMCELAGGEANVVGWWIHEDEVHEYKDAETGENKVSRKHIHFMFVPEIDGKLNGKKAYSKPNLLFINNALDELSKNYGLSFLKGEGQYYGVSHEDVEQIPRKERLSRSPARSDASVEKLKIASSKKLEETLKEQQKTVERNNSLIAQQQTSIAENDRRLAEQAKAMEIFDSKDIRDTRLFKHFKENALKSKETAQMIAKPFSVAKIQKNLQELQSLVDEQMRKQKKQEERDRELELIQPSKSGQFDRSL
jgi:hypothetical protein